MLHSMQPVRTTGHVTRFGTRRATQNTPLFRRGHFTRGLAAFYTARVKSESAPTAKKRPVRSPNGGIADESIEEGTLVPAAKVETSRSGSARTKKRCRSFGEGYDTRFLQGTA